MEGNIFDDHQQYNKFMSLGGHRVSQSSPVCNISIACKQLTRTIKEMNVRDMKEILHSKLELSEVALEYNHKKLIAKLDTLQDWQIAKAHHIWLHTGRIESVEYLSRCKKTDKH